MEFGVNNWAIADLSDLSRLANEFRNERSRKIEVNPLNEFYGLAAVVKDFAGLNQSSPLYIQLPHAPLNSLRGYDAESMGVLGCYSTTRVYQALDLALHYRPLAPLPLPFPYLMAKEINNKKIEDKDTGRSRCLYFVSKSTMRVEHRLTEIEKEIITRDVLRLRESFSEVNCCIFWKDIELSTYTGVYDLFDSIFCAGGQFDPNFLIKLNYIIESHSLIASRFDSTHTLCSLISSISVVRIESSKQGDICFRRIDESVQLAHPQTNSLKDFFGSEFLSKLDADYFVEANHAGMRMQHSFPGYLKLAKSYSKRISNRLRDIFNAI